MHKIKQKCFQLVKSRARLETFNKAMGLISQSVYKFEIQILTGVMLFTPENDN